jgi:hypothetical protein
MVCPADPQDLRRRQGLHAEAALALCDMLACVEVECQAVRAVAGGSDAPRGAGSKRNKWVLGGTYRTSSWARPWVAQLVEGLVLGRMPVLSLTVPPCCLLQVGAGCQ